MRPFNKQEQQIIKAIANIPKNIKHDFSLFLKENLFTIKSLMAILIIPENDIAVLYVKEEHLFYDKFYNLLEFLHIMEYLKNEKYTLYASLTKNKTEGITFIHQEMSVTSENPSSNKVVLNTKGDYLLKSAPQKIFNNKGEQIFTGYGFTKSESNIYTMILDHFFGLVYPTEELKQFVKDNFKTKDDLNVRTSIRLAVIAILVSLLTLDINNLKNLVGFITVFLGKILSNALTFLLEIPKFIITWIMY